MTGAKLVLTRHRHPPGESTKRPGSDFKNTSYGRENSAALLLSLHEDAGLQISVTPASGEGVATLSHFKSILSDGQK